MIIFAGIDGTGPADDQEYQQGMTGSCINQLYRKEVVPFDMTFYHRGPSLLGMETRTYAEIAHAWVLERWQSGAAKAIFLGGYSRGAAAVIEVAYWLDQRGIPVECLILFDAVDRSIPGPGGGVGHPWSNRKIAANVKQTIHPMRNIITTGSRLSFGRCGDKQENAAMPHAREYFFATHGGAGGVPWKQAVLPVTGFPNPTGLIWETGEINSTSVTPVADSNGAAMMRSWTFPKIQQAFVNCKQALQPVAGQPVGQPGAGLPGQPVSGQPVGLPGGSLPPTAGQRIHIVKSGDWLSKIAITYYGDMNKWTKIYEHNKAVIGPNPDLIKPGQQLVIPL